MAFVTLIHKGTGGGGAGASWFTFHWFTSDGVPSEAQTLAEAMRDRLNGNLQAFLSNSWSLGRIDSIWWTGLNVPALPTQVHTVNTIVGAISTDSMSPRQTMMIEFKAFSLKPNRKRCYIGRYSESQNEATGIPSSALIAAVQGYADDMLTTHNLSGHDYVPVVLRKDAEGRVTAYNQLTSHLVQTKWAFLRSRDVGRGT